MAGLLDFIGKMRGSMLGASDAARLQTLQRLGMVPAEVDPQQQATALARQLARVGFQATGPQASPGAATAVGLMMDPSTRQEGIAAAQGILGGVSGAEQPLTPWQGLQAELQQQRLKIEMAREERLARVDPAAALRLEILRAREARLAQESGRVPSGQIEALVNEEAIAAGFDATAASMKPEYFGYGFDTAAFAAEEFKRRTGSDTEFTAFWNQLDTAQAERRHELFGATLTEGEQRAWNKIAIRPSDNFAAAQAKLYAQQQAIERKRSARAEVLQGQGYKVPEARPSLEEIFGSP